MSSWSGMTTHAPIAKPLGVAPPSVAEFTTGTGDRLTCFSTYRAWIERLLADIDQAQDEIVVEMYIFEPEGEGGHAAAALMRAAARGVRVRVMVDSLGCRHVSPLFFTRLREAGIDVHIFKPIHWWSFLLTPGKPLRRRNHRKLIVIDRRVGHLGGMNLGGRFTDWRDLSLRIEGPFAVNLRGSHERVWTGRYRKTFLPRSRKKRSLPEIQLFDNFFTDHYSPIKKHYVAAFKRARRRIWLAHGYFFPDKRLRRELRRAMRRGVQVHVIVPASSDIAAVDKAAKHIFGNLLRSGVRLYLLGDMLHAKAALVDDDWLTLGSANLDPISLFSCLEINVGIRHKDLTAHLAAIIDHYKSEAEEYTYDDWKHRSRWEKLTNQLWYRLRHWYAKW